MNDSDADGSDLAPTLSALIGHGLAVNSGVHCVIEPAISISMNDWGEYGYTVPDALEPDVEERLRRVSSIGGTGPNETEIAASLFAEHPDIQGHPIAGLHLASFAGWAADEDIRNAASSGGIATALGIHLLETGAVDGLIQMAPSSDGELFRYVIARSADEVRANTKTRYYPGELGGTLTQALLTRERFALIGIPSFIHEVRLLQEVRPEFKDIIVFTIGLICGHQKTARYAEYLAWTAGISPDSIESIDFRKKIPGLPANVYKTEVLGYRNGHLVRAELMPGDVTGADWGLGYFKSSWSDFSDDALNETADLVLGDAWLPEYTSDSRGTNVVIARSEHALALLKEMEARSDVYLEEISIERVVASQTALVKHAIVELPYRYSILQRRGRYTPPIRRPSTRKPSLDRRMIQRKRLLTSSRSHEAFASAREVGNLADFNSQMQKLNTRYYRAQLISRAYTKALRLAGRLLGRLWGGVRG